MLIFEKIKDSFLRGLQKKPHEISFSLNENLCEAKYKLIAENASKDVFTVYKWDGLQANYVALGTITVAIKNVRIKESSDLEQIIFLPYDVNIKIKHDSDYPNEIPVMELKKIFWLISI